jgi:coproporphyrinogen III oxidase-like Fe-S oxidoreductase
MVSMRWRAISGRPSGAVQQGMERYVDHLCREIAATPVAHTGPDAHSEIEHPHPVPRTPLRTVFFGGGTPSLAGPHLTMTNCVKTL